VASMAVKYMEYYDGPKQQGSPVYGAAGQSRTNCTIAAGNITGILNPKSDDVSVAFSPHFAVFAQANTFDIIIPYYVMQEMRGIMTFGGAGFVPTYSYTSHAGHLTTILLEHGGHNNRDSTHYDVEETANQQHSNEAGKGQTIPAHTSQHLSATDLASVQLRGMERSNTTEGDGPARGYRQHLFEISELRSSWVLMFSVGGICDLTVPWEHDDASWPTTALRVAWAGDEHPPESRDQWIKAMRGTYSIKPLERGAQYTVMGTAHDDLHQHYGTQSAHHAVGWPREGWPHERTIQREPRTQNTGAFDTDNRPGRITSTPVTVRLRPGWHTGLDAKSFMAQRHKFEFRDHTLPSNPRAQELPRTPGDHMEAKLASANRKYHETQAGVDRDPSITELEEGNFIGAELKARLAASDARRAAARHELLEAQADLTCQERNDLHVEDIGQPRIQDVGCNINTFATDWPDLFTKLLARTGKTGTFVLTQTSSALRTAVLGLPMHGSKKYIPLNRPGQLRGGKIYEVAGFNMTRSLNNSRMYIPLDRHGRLRGGETHEPAGFNMTNFACTSTTLFEWAMHKGWGFRAGQGVINRDLCTYAAIAGQWDNVVLAHRCYGLPCSEAPLNLAITRGDVYAYMMLRALRFPRNQTGLLLRLAIRNGDLRIIDQTARDERELHRSVAASMDTNAPPTTPLGSGWSERVMTLAASTPDSRDTIAVLHRLGAPWGAETCKAAFLAGNLTSLKYLLRHGCPWSAQARRQCLSRMDRLVAYTYEPVSEIWIPPQQTLWQHSNDVLARRLNCSLWAREKNEGRNTECHLRSCDENPLLIATDEGPKSRYMMWEIKFPTPLRGELRGEPDDDHPIAVPHHTMAHLSAAQQSYIQARGMERSNSTDGDGPNSIQHSQQDQPDVFDIDDLLAAARPHTEWIIAAMADTDAHIPSSAEQLLAETCDVYMSRADTSEIGDLETPGDEPAQAAYRAPMTFEIYYEDVARTWELRGPVALWPSADQAETWNLSLQSLDLLLQQRGLTNNILVVCFGSVVKTPTGKRRSSTKFVHEELSSLLSTSLGSGTAHKL